MYPIHNLPVEQFFSRQLFTDDLGAISKGLFKVRKRIKIADLSPRQTHVSGGTLNYKMKGKGFTVPYVVIKNNHFILIDGHHTVIVKQAKGQTYVFALTYNTTN